MGTVADKLSKLLSTKADIRAAITEMGQAVAETAVFSSYAARIRAISSDANAASADILSGKTAYAGGEKITGTIASKGASDLTANGAAVSVPAGYYPEDASKSVAAATQATPSISVSSNGLITASVTQGAGYVAAGTKSAASQLATQAAATITPGTSAKTAVAAGRYTTGAVQVAGDANLVAANIKSGVSIFGVAGNLVTPTYGTVTVVNRSGMIGYVSSLQKVDDVIWIYQYNALQNGSSVSFSHVNFSPILLGSNMSGNLPTVSLSNYGNCKVFKSGQYNWFFLELFASGSFTITINP